MDIQNKRLEESELLAQREAVLATWKTGAEVDLEEAIEYQKSLPESKNFSAKMNKARAERKTLIQPRAGVPLISKQIELLNYLYEEGGADLLPSTIDSYTRQNLYEEAEKGIEASIRTGKAMLNGFPAVNHGVSGCRTLVESIEAPLQVRHGTPDARLLAEITYAGGYTSYEGGAISYTIPYSKNASIEKGIRDWQYVDRLTGLYEEAGVEINREPFGPLTGTLVPPCISHSVAIIEALLAAEQGVKNITVGYGQLGNLVQDVAAIRSLQKLTEEYLSKFGHDDCRVTTVLHQWMGGFPQDEAKSFGVISWGSATAALANATKVIVKTPHEALGVPTMVANAQGLRTTKQVINMVGEQRLVGSDVAAEMGIITQETYAILSAVLEAGNGDIAQGAVKAFEAGLIDIPFAPNRYNAGKMLPVRDNNGAVRIMDFGNLPFTDDLRAFHKDKLTERGQTEGRDVSFQMVIDDIYAVGKGRLVGRPQ